MAFTGTLDKCKACDKTVYVVDMMSLEGVPYHKSCFKCSHCKGFLSVGYPVSLFLWPFFSRVSTLYFRIVFSFLDNLAYSFLALLSHF